nr:hypothetical protein [Kibdelosporangium sp. MJ126-NF4]
MCTDGARIANAIADRTVFSSGRPCLMLCHLRLTSLPAQSHAEAVAGLGRKSHHDPVGVLCLPNTVESSCV